MPVTKRLEPGFMAPSSSFLGAEESLWPLEGENKVNEAEVREVEEAGSDYLPISIAVG